MLGTLDLFVIWCLEFGIFMHRFLRMIPISFILIAFAHFLYRQSSGRIAGVQDTAIDWDTIDQLVSLLPREVYAARLGQGDPYLIVRDNGRELYPEDRVKFFPDPNLGLGSMLSVQRALAVEVNDGGEVKVIRTWTKSVGELLDEQLIEIGEKDQLNPSRETEFASLCHFDDPERGRGGGEISTGSLAFDQTQARDDIMRQNCKITIIRVIETEVKETEPIAFATKTRNDPEVDKGLTKIEQKGKKGKRAKYYLVRRENGKTVDKKFLRQEVVEEPIDELIILGTKVIVLGEGRATWFGAPAMTAAHNTLPRGTKVRVVNKANGKAVVVKIIGGGIQGGAIIDLSPDAFKKLAPLSSGVIPVRLEKE